MPASIEGGQVHEHGRRQVNEYPRSRRISDVADIVHAPDIYRCVSLVKIFHQYLGIGDEGTVLGSRVIGLGVIVSGKAGGRILSFIPGNVHFPLIRVLGLPILEIVSVTQQVRGSIGWFGIDLYRKGKI